jgi:thiamine biosynthesis lipoprotein
VNLTEGQLDLGGIVKGWTADLAVEALEGDYGDIFVNAGGDIRCAGSDRDGEGWEIRVEAPRSGLTVWEGRVSGAVATSTTMKRRWKTDGGEWAHHLINPATGLPSESAFVQVTAFGEAAWRSEVWAKAVLIGGEDAGLRARRAGVDLLTLDAQGKPEMLKAFA